MTILKENIYNLTDRDKLEELLIKNLPNRINGSNEKTTANRFNHPTKVALNKCDFIHFNSKERVSFIIFDIDKIGSKTAREVYPTISKFWEYLHNKLSLEISYITQTTKGYHFAFHLSYHVYLVQGKALNYLNAIREAINTICGCDIHANRHYGIWRNPLRHEFYYSGCINYDLADFKDLLKERKKYPKRSKKYIQKKFHYDVSLRQQNKDLFIEGHRNSNIFIASLKYAKNKKDLTLNDIYYYIVQTNHKCDVPLEDEELQSIASSAYRIYITEPIRVSSFEAYEPRDINEGIMNFTKMSCLSKIDYDKETKRRQSQAAHRTNKIKKDKTIGLDKARKAKSKKYFAKNLELVRCAEIKLKNEGENITISAIARLTNLDRKTVRKYINFLID